MKKTLLQRFGALALCAMMAFGLMATPAMATEGENDPVDPRTTETQTGSTAPKTMVTINNAIGGTTYKLYKVLALQRNTAGDKNLYTYTYEEALEPVLDAILKAGYGKLMNEDGTYKRFESNTDGSYKSGMRGDDAAGGKCAFFVLDKDNNRLGFQLFVKQADDTYVSADESQYLEWEQETNFGRQFAADFAKELDTRIVDASKLPEAAKIEVGKKATTGQASVEYGYYLILSGVTPTGDQEFNATRRRITHSVFGETMAINEKNSKPTLDKQVLLDNGENQYGKENDKGVGDLVHYRVEIDTGAGVTGLKFTDTLSGGLTFVSLDSIQFFGRNADGKVFSSNDAATNQKNADNGIKAPVWDLNWDQGNNSELVVNGNREAYAGGQYGTQIGKGGSLTATTTLIDANDSTSVQKGYHNFNVDASYANNVIEIKFAQQWLMSKRAESSDTVGTATNRDQFKMDPMQPGDSRLPDDFSGNAAWFNQYVGDTTTTDDDGGIIVIYYTAKINDNAKINDVGNPNGAHLDYSNDPEFNPDGTNPPWEPSNDDQTTTYVYEIDLLKYDKSNDRVMLPGAKFEVRKAGYNDVAKTWITATNTVTVPDAVDSNFGDSNKAIWFVETAEGYRVATEAERIAGLNDDGETVKEGANLHKELVTGPDGKIKVRGLDSDLYQLKETEAPDGYVKMDEGTYVYVVLGGVESETTAKEDKRDADGNLVKEDNETVQNTVAKVFVQDVENGGKDTKVFKLTDKAATSVYAFGVENASGMKMPETGGIGTTIFYVVGGLLIVGAGALLIVKKRVGRSED